MRGWCLITQGLEWAGVMLEGDGVGWSGLNRAGFSLESNGVQHHSIGTPMESLEFIGVQLERWGSVKYCTMVVMMTSSSGAAGCSGLGSWPRTDSS